MTGEPANYVAQENQAQRTFENILDARRVSSVPLKFAVENNGTGLVVYFGEAAPGTLKSQALWRIYKLTYDGNNAVTDKQWADGVATFNKEWDERATYTYSS